MINDVIISPQTCCLLNRLMYTSRFYLLLNKYFSITLPNCFLLILTQWPTEKVRNSQATCPFRRQGKSSPRNCLHFRPQNSHRRNGRRVDLSRLDRDLDTRSIILTTGNVARLLGQSSAYIIRCLSAGVRPAIDSRNL